VPGSVRQVACGRWKRSRGGTRPRSLRPGARGCPWPAVSPGTAHGRLGRRQHRHDLQYARTHSHPITGLLLPELVIAVLPPSADCSSLWLNCSRSRLSASTRSVAIRALVDLADQMTIPTAAITAPTVPKRGHDGRPVRPGHAGDHHAGKGTDASGHYSGQCLFR
jgi:hypothetical protein